mmetsp:Transcript_14229/g.21034  ORF Transcript_14229/g.21034 Transcript_14229/m.21034 type:complete len:121 (-) Transcript_14229:382-744(-)
MTRLHRIGSSALTLVEMAMSVKVSLRTMFIQSARWPTQSSTRTTKIAVRRCKLPLIQEKAMLSMSFVNGYVPTQILRGISRATEEDMWTPCCYDTVVAATSNSRRAESCKYFKRVELFLE